jgi:hypothetical protein
MPFSLPSNPFAGMSLFPGDQDWQKRFRWGGILGSPEGGDLGVPGATPPTGSWADKFAQKLDSPGAQLGLRILAGNRGGQSTGNVLGNAVLGYQQDKAQSAQSDLQRKLIEAQIQKMTQPEQDNSAPVVVIGPDGKPRYASRRDAIGQTPYENPQGSPAQAGAIQEYDAAKSTGFKGSYLDFLKERASAGSIPTPSFGTFQGADGKWYVVNNRTGAVSPTNVGVPAKPVGEAQVKQDIGIRNLGQAVDEYVKALPTLSMGGYLNPSEHARIGTVYNNMMLQAKEAYNLGVLNGPDFEILQKIVTNPMTLKGLVTSNDDLAKQATELKRIMEKMRGNVIGAKPRPTGAQSPSDEDPLGLFGSSGGGF